MYKFIPVKYCRCDFLIYILMPKLTFASVNSDMMVWMFSFPIWRWTLHRKSVMCEAAFRGHQTIHFNLNIVLTNISNPALNSLLRADFRVYIFWIPLSFVWTRVLIRYCCTVHMKFFCWHDFHFVMVLWRSGIFITLAGSEVSSFCLLLVPLVFCLDDQSCTRKEAKECC